MVFASAGVAARAAAADADVVATPTH